MGVISFLRRVVSRRVGVEHRQFRALTGTVLGGERARCPHCRRGRLRIDPEANDVRICDAPACGARVPLSALAEVFAVADDQAARVAAQERQSAVLFLAGAEGLLVFCAAWAIWTRSWATLLGGTLLSIVVGAMALVARYRAWQIQNGRMFERQAPLGAYLRWELAGLLGRR